MRRWTTIQVRFHQGRFLAGGPWPPAPSRLFQALVAGAGRGADLDPSARTALTWLEEEAPPTVFAPAATFGSEVTQYVPHNNLDAHGGDPARAYKVRAPKHTKPRLFDADRPLVYAWALEEAPPLAELERLCERLCTLGRGQDQAWARLVVLQETQLDALVEGLGRYEPTPGGIGGLALTVPCPGSLESLEVRHQAWLKRLEWQGRKQVLRRPPDPVFREVTYGGQAHQRLLEWRLPTGEFLAQTPTRVVRLVEQVRDTAEGLLSQDPALQPLAAGWLSGRARTADAQDRVQLIPLPSIGHPHADGCVRRLLVRVPPGCPMEPRDVWWGLESAACGDARLVPASESKMWSAHYRGPSARWESVTPLALPATRRRLEPGIDRKAAAERLDEHAAAELAVATALRHAGIQARLRHVRVQREPFRRWSERAEAYAQDTRFSKEGLWHVRLTLDRALTGPLVLGNGRFVGLGVMAPASQRDSGARVWSLQVLDGLRDDADPLLVARAVRRALLSRMTAGRGTLSAYLSGHEADGTPTQGRDHLAVALLRVNGPQVLVIAPAAQGRARDLRILENALDGFTQVRAGRAGLLSLGAPHCLEVGPVLGPARRWFSHTPYVPTRHAKAGSARAMVERDVLRECERASLPRPEVNVVEVRSGKLVQATLWLRFAAPVDGPILLGRTRYRGGGLFVASDSV